MESNITMPIRGKYMEKLFDDLNIRHFQVRYINESDYNPENIYTFDIVVRHSKDENAEDLINSLLLDYIR